MDRIDEIDARILELLQEQGRMKRNRIAEDVGMSLPSISDRMRKLEERGVIKGYYAVLDAKRMHYDIMAFIRVTVDGSANYRAFVEKVVGMDEVQEVHSITGDGSHALKVRTHDTASLEKLLSSLQSMPGVHGTSSSIVLSTYKESRVLKAKPMVLVHPETETVR
jgi:Lrp/AsnC family transcriptional regulator, leucine-responsive regulatory protein